MAHPPIRCLANVGGRKTRARLDMLPPVKQGPPLSIPRRIPGTTKVRYTNNKGRTFTFSIPVAQMTHPPVIREGAAPGGWKHIDTSYCDTGELEEDMPSPVQDFIRKHAVRREDLERDAALGDGHASPSSWATRLPGEATDVFLQLEEDSLVELQTLFVDFCRRYVLMDTQGMKTSLSYGELNNGPDYEMYDRKLMRKRYWLAIRHRYEDVAEVLWPSSLLNPEDAAGHEEVPTLSAEQMLDALVWLEAASTFCVRSHRPYDLASEDAFLPLDLSREVRVIASRVRSHSRGSFFSSAGTARTLSDRLLSCAALCAKYSVPFSAFFSDPTEGSRAGRCSTKADIHHVLLALPELHTCKAAIRIINVLEGMATTDSLGDHSETTASCGRPQEGGRIAGDFESVYAFSDAHTGAITDAALADSLTRLCGGPLFGTADALENVAESELCVLARFVVRVREQNPVFFRTEPAHDTAGKALAALESFTALVLARCRHLLYRLGGPQTGVMSGDDEYIPLIDMQRDSEQANPQALVHYKIGMETAMGMRFTRLRAGGSATLVQLLDRLESTGAATGLETLVSDLVEHVAQKAAAGNENLTLRDVICVLPLLGKKLRSPVDPPTVNGDHTAKVQERYRRLFAAMSTAIGSEMQRGHVTAADLVALLEGLAACHHVPSSLPQVEMVLLRMSLLHRMTLEAMNRALNAMARLVGPQNVFPSLFQNAAGMIMDACAEPVSTSPLRPETLSEAFTLARTLQRCYYGAFPSLLVSLKRRGVLDVEGYSSYPPHYATRLTAEAGVLLALAAESLSDSDPDCAKLCALGRTALARALSDMGCPGASTPRRDAVLDADLLVDVVTSCAALSVPITVDQFHHMERSLGWSSTAHGDTRPLHSLCTPLMGIGVLESLEALGLTNSATFKATMAYVDRVLSQLTLLTSESEAHPGSAVALLADDAEVAVRALYLHHAPSTVRRNAAAVLEREVMRLDSALDGGVHDAASGLQPTSFEKTNLQRSENATKAEKELLRYCAAVQHARSTAAEA